MRAFVHQSKGGKPPMHYAGAFVTFHALASALRAQGRGTEETSPTRFRIKFAGIPRDASSQSAGNPGAFYFGCDNAPSYGIDACVAGLAAGRFRGLHRGRRRAGAGAGPVRRFSQHPPRHPVWHQQKRVRLGHGHGHLAVQPAGRHALAGPAACGRRRLRGLVRGRLGGHRHLAGLFAQGAAVHPAGRAGATPWRARSWAASMRPAWPGAAKCWWPAPSAC
jgi:hypothetical protein